MSSILNGRRKLSSRADITIKPNLSFEERKKEQLLLKERRSLINSSTLRSAIRLHGLSLYVNNIKYGVVRNNKFEVCRVKDESDIVAKMLYH